MHCVIKLMDFNQVQDRNLWFPEKDLQGSSILGSSVWGVNSGSVTSSKNAAQMISAPLSEHNLNSQQNLGVGNTSALSTEKFGIRPVPEIPVSCIR